MWYLTLREEYNIHVLKKVINKTPRSMREEIKHIHYTSRFIQFISNIIIVAISRLL